MATYRGNEIPEKPEIDPGAGAISGRRSDKPDAEDVAEGLGAPESAEPDYMRKPGDKHYLDPLATDQLQMAALLRQLIFGNHANGESSEIEQQKLRSPPFNQYPFKSEDKFDEYLENQPGDKDVLPYAPLGLQPPAPVQGAALLRQLMFGKQAAAPAALTTRPPEEEVDPVGEALDLEEELRAPPFNKMPIVPQEQEEPDVVRPGTPPPGPVHQSQFQVPGAGLDLRGLLQVLSHLLRGRA